MTLASNQYGDRSVVCELDIHHRPENARADFRLSKFFLEITHELPVELLRDLRACGFDKTGPVSLPGVRVQGELRYHKGASAGLSYRKIHFPRWVLKNPEIGALLSEVRCLCRRVCRRHSQKHEHPLPDFIVELAFDR